MCSATVILLALSLSVMHASTAEAVPIGKGKQLFVDDFIIDSQENLSRILHHPQRYSGNPVLTGTEAWERWLLEVNGRPVLYDEETRQFRMYYGANLDDPTAPSGTRYKVCYAVSKDGVHWTRVPLGQVEWQGSRANNILKWGENWMRRPNVIMDAADPDMRRRFKMTYVDVVNGNAVICKAYSQDGIHWRLNGDGEPVRGGANSNLLGWDPHIGRYVLYPRVAGPPTRAGRSRSDAIGRSISADFVTWSEPEPVLVAEPSDRNRDFKGLAAFLYSDAYLGLLWIFEGEKSAEAELAFSRDGIRWQRVSPGEMFFHQGGPESWDSNGILPVAPVIHGNRIYFYYAGWNVPYTNDTVIKQRNGTSTTIAPPNAALRRVREGWIENGTRKQWAIGLATLRLDGFVSLRAGHAAGALTTKPLEVAGATLAANADVRGELRAEILDEDGNRLPGYGAGDCSPIRSDNMRHLVRWRGKTNVADLRGKHVKLRFTLHDGDLYSFWFE
ncbi:MAG: hypothetical protein DMG69_28225 [Acidobacteria bacterium]|nr:MAG: hypothetical protein DMG69_28225 [Acidobacteriota bacterium]